MATIAVKPAHTSPEVMNIIRGRTFEDLAEELTDLAGGFVPYRQRSTDARQGSKWVLIPDTPWSITLDHLCDETAYSGDDALELLAWVINGALNLFPSHRTRNGMVA